MGRVRRGRYGRSVARIPPTKRKAQDGRPGAFSFFGPSPERAFATSVGMPEGEFGAVMFIGMVDDPANPPCPGPVVVHEDGSIECEGGCGGVAFAYHGPGSTVGCDIHGGSTSFRCRRCRGL
jgi:hypothetical protein